MSSKIALIVFLFAWNIQAGDIVHFTPQGSGFETELIIRNTSHNTGWLSLNLYAPDSEPEKMDVQLVPKQTLVLAGADFPHWPDHLSYHTSDLVQISVRYSSGNAWVVQPGIVETAQSHLYAYLDPDVFWQGLAVVNHSIVASSVVLHQYDASGSLLKEFVLGNELLNNKKLLVVVSDLDLVKDRESYLELETSRSVSAMMLYGNDPLSNTPILAMHQPEKRYKNHISVGYSGGIGGWVGWVEMTEGKVTLGSSEAGVFDANNAVGYAAIRDELIALGAIELEVNAAEQDCCDQFFFHLTIVDGSKRNQFAFSTFDGQDEAAAKGLAMIKMVFEKAISITDGNVWLPF